MQERAGRVLAVREADVPEAARYEGREQRVADDVCSETALRHAGTGSGESLLLHDPGAPGGKRFSAARDPVSLDPGAKYRARVDFANVNDAHSLAVGAVPPGSDVLDIGCADGSMAEALGAMACRVWGIERDGDAAERARQVCEDVVVGDLEEIELRGAFHSRKFSAVLMLDVLEHLADPGRLLGEVVHVLAPDGYAVLSVPNISHAAMRLQLLGGRFSYTDLGLLDRTHLRFFDRPGLEAMIEGSGFEVVDELPVEFDIDATEIDVDLGAVPGAVVADILGDPHALTYQWVVVVAPAGSEVLGASPLPPLWILQRQFRQDMQAYRRASLELRKGVDELAAESSQRQAILAELMDDLRSFDGDPAAPPALRARALESELEGSEARARGLEVELGAVGAQLRQLQEAFEARTGELARAEAELAALEATRTFRYTNMARKLYHRLRLRGDGA